MKLPHYLAVAMAVSLMTMHAQDEDAAPAEDAADTSEEAATTEEAAPEEEPVNERALMDKVSVAYGTKMAQDLTSGGILIDPEKFAQAYQTILDEKKPLMSDEEIAETFSQLNDYINGLKSKEGREFLEANASKEGVKVTDSGLQYIVLEEGEGDKPAATDTVTVHYEGSLINGSVFDSSIERGEPTSFPLNRVIAGWTEGVQLMSPGAKYKFFIPYNLAYGEQGSPPRIPGFSTLIFEVELIKIGE